MSTNSELDKLAAAGIVGSDATSALQQLHNSLKIPDYPTWLKRTRTQTLIEIYAAHGADLGRIVWVLRGDA